MLEAPDLPAAWIANPDAVSFAIKLLVGAVGVCGTALIAVLLYIWHEHKKYVTDIVTEIKTNVEKIAVSLDSMAVNFEHRLTKIESRCEERCKLDLRN